MRPLRLLLFSILPLAIPLHSTASAETREEYLTRLKEVCAVECLQPREFQRTARKRARDDERDMAIIMDVAHIRRAGDKLELHNVNLESTHFDDLFNLEAAGINTSNRNGVGGLPRGRRSRSHPNLIVVEMDQATLFDLLNPPSASPSAQSVAEDGADIVVEDDRDRKFTTATLAALKDILMNRRIVVRGNPRFEIAWVGARRDYRRKQVILQVDNADDLVMLPRYDKDGQPKPDEHLPWLAVEQE